MEKLTLDQQKTLNRLFEDGYLITMEDEKIELINTPEENNSDTYTYSIDNGDFDQDLSDVYPEQIKVYARVDWAEKIPLHERAVLDGVPTLPCLQDWNDDLDRTY